MTARAYERPMGDISRRLRGVALQLARRADAARLAAKHSEALGQTEFAASLRGKANAYDEAVALIKRLEQGQKIRRTHRWLRRAS